MKILLALSISSSHVCYSGMYEILVCNGTTIDADKARVFKTQSSPYTIESLPHNEIHVIAVRFVTETGLKSELSPGYLINVIEGR